jgi:hypothetical protein
MKQLHPCGIAVVKYERRVEPMILKDLIKETTPEQRFIETVTSEGRGRKRKYYDSRTKLIGERYYVYPIALTDVHVFIICPYCHKIHFHGNPGGNYAGHRVSHCIDGNINNGYVICKLDSGENEH